MAFSFNREFIKCKLSFFPRRVQTFFSTLVIVSARVRHSRSDHVLDSRSPDSSLPKRALDATEPLLKIGGK